MSEPNVKDEPTEPSADQPDPPPEPDETEIKCTLCGLRACWSAS